MERKIGDIIEFNGQKFQIKKGSCYNCYFDSKSMIQCTKVRETFGNCFIKYTIYPIKVYYKLVKE